MDKLMNLAEVEKLILDYDGGITVYFHCDALRQLAATMRENERLRDALQAVVNSGNQCSVDIARQALNPYKHYDYATDYVQALKYNAALNHDPEEIARVEKAVGISTKQSDYCRCGDKFFPARVVDLCATCGKYR